MRKSTKAMSMVALVAASAAQAQDLNLSCSGAAFDWSLTLDGTAAELTLGATTEMEVMHEARAEGAGWPRALTLIGDRDTAILILDPRQCAADPEASHTAHLLTQRGQSPIFLTGCCRTPE